MDLLPICHNPSTPVRPDVLGEVVFVEAWRRLMDAPLAFYADESTRLDDILSQYRNRPGQREATVCASLMCWFGTSCGQGFLHAAHCLSEKLGEHKREDAYLAAWTIENSRSTGSGGVRTLEHCMATETAPSSVGLRRLPAELTADDYEVAECLARWLGSSDGQKFLAFCEADLKRRLTPIRFPFGEAA